MLGIHHIARHVARREAQVINALSVQTVPDFNQLAGWRKKQALHKAVEVYNTLATCEILNGNERRIGHELISIAAGGTTDKVLMSVDADAASYIQFIWNKYSLKSLDRHSEEREFMRFFKAKLEYHLSVN